MHWKLLLNQKEGRLELWNDEHLQEAVTWNEERNTSQEILGALEELRLKAGVDWADIPELQIEMDLPPHSTARRIAETVQNTYNTFVVREKSSKGSLSS